MIRNDRHDWLTILKDAKRCPDDGYVHPSDLARPVMPNFGWRIEHKGTETLAQWAQANGMYETLFGALEQLH